MTNLPWDIISDPESPVELYTLVVDAKGEAVADCGIVGRSDEENEAAARLIVERVNGAREGPELPNPARREDGTPHFSHRWMSVESDQPPGWIGECGECGRWIESDEALKPCPFRPKAGYAIAIERDGTWHYMTPAHPSFPHATPISLVDSPEPEGGPDVRDLICNVCEARRRGLRAGDDCPCPPCPGHVYFEPSPTEADGVALIAAERARQIEKEGYTPEHDDEHNAERELLTVAHEIIGEFHPRLTQDTDDRWGLIARHWRKPDGELRLLTIAGALIAAEIDRLLRATPTAPRATWCTTCGEGFANEHEPVCEPCLRRSTPTGGERDG